jgi:hypothetical protein
MSANGINSWNPPQSGPDWLNAEWMHEYQQALDQAEAAEDDSPSDQD